MRIQSTLRVVSASLTLIALASNAAAQQPPSYTVQFITPDLSAISASAMSEDGDVVGTSTTGSGAWVSHAGAPGVLLPLPPGAQFAFANDINDAGVIVGSVGPTSSVGFGKAVAWFPNGAGGYTIQEFGTLPGHVASEATAVNNIGDIVGFSFDGTFRLPVLFSAPGGIEDLSSTGIFDPTDINDQRVLVNHAFAHERFSLNSMMAEALGVPAGPPNYSTPWVHAINESGQVAGSLILTTSTSCDRVAARYTDGIGWQVFSGCGTGNGASFINDLGDVVMRLNVAPYVRFQGIGTFLIEDLIVSDVGHWFVINGAGPINNSRQIAIPATNSVTGEAGMILLTPIPVAGDLNGSGGLDEEDRTMFCHAIGSSLGEPTYLAAADFDANGVIDHLDQQAFNELLPPCAGDIVSSTTFQPPADGAVNGADLAYLLGAWGHSASCADFVTNKTFQPPPDGVVDAADLAFMLGAWGECP